MFPFSHVTKNIVYNSGYKTNTTAVGPKNVCYVDIVVEHIDEKVLEAKAICPCRDDTFLFWRGTV